MKFSLLSASVLALSLGACSGTSPNYMPTGYKYHSDVYKSPTPPPTPKLNVEQRQYMDAAQAEQFRDGVYELLVRITERAGMPPKPVYVMSPEPMTAFYANIDNDLRESMRSIGYVLSDTPVGAYVFAYDAGIIGQETKQRLSKIKKQPMSTGTPNVALTLQIFDSLGENARMLTQETGQFFIRGAEALHIQPPSFKRMTNNQRVQRQAAPAQVRRAPVQRQRPVVEQQPVMQAPMAEPMMQPAPQPAFETQSLSSQVPMGDMSMQAPQPQAPIVANSSTLSSAPYVDSYIDDNGTLHSPSSSDRPSMGTSTRPRVSRAQ